VEHIIAFRVAMQSERDRQTDRQREREGRQPWSWRSRRSIEFYWRKGQRTNSTNHSDTCTKKQKQETCYTLFCQAQYLRTSSSTLSGSSNLHAGTDGQKDRRLPSAQTHVNVSSRVPLSSAQQKPSEVFEKLHQMPQYVREQNFGAKTRRDTLYYLLRIDREDHCTIGPFAGHTITFRGYFLKKKKALGLEGEGE
jgi:hypothetical protein